MIIVENDESIWERLPAGEPPRAYFYAWTYFAMGPTRSLARLSPIVKTGLRQLKRWSTRCNWVERAAAYDHRREQEDSKEAVAAHLRETEKWAKRAAEFNERLDQVGIKLEKLGALMLAFPSTEARRVLETDETGRPSSLQIVEPPKCAKRDIPRMVEAGCRLAKQALQEVSEENSVKLVDVIDLVPYESKGARVTATSETNRQAV